MKKIFLKISNIISKKADIITLIFLAFYIGTLTISTTSIYLYSNVFMSVIKIIRYFCYFYFAIKIVIDWKNGVSITYPMVIAVALGFLIYIFSKNINIMFLILVMIAFRNVKFEKILKTFLIVQITCFATIILSSQLGIIEDWMFTRRGELVRHSLGFYYATIPSSMFFIIELAYCYNKKSKITFLELAVGELIALLIYKYTDSKTGFVLVSSTIISVCMIKLIIKTKIIKYFNNVYINKIFNVLCYILPTILVAFSIIIMLLYSQNNIIGSVDSLLTKRIYYSNKAFNQYGFSLFGRPIQWNGWGGVGYVSPTNLSYNYVDISYLRILFDYGIVGIILTLLLYTYSLVKSYKEKKYWMIFSLILVLICACIEPNLLKIHQNIFVLSSISLFNYGKIKILDYEKIKKKVMKKSEKINY